MRGWREKTIKLLDETFLIHHWEGRNTVADYLERHEESVFVTMTLNIKEIAVGRELQGKLDAFESYSQFASVRILPF